MILKKIYLVRHGKIMMEDKEKYFIGQTDLPLDDDGEEQVNRLAEMLSRIKISSVFCSDLIRSVVTAEKISAYHGITPVLNPDLREISLGDWDGLTFTEVKNRYPDEFKLRGIDIVNFCPPNGESFYDCGKRVISAFEDIVHEAEENILIAGHAGVNRLILCHVMGLPIENLFNVSQDYGCLNVISSGISHYRLELLNETGYFKLE